MKSTLYMETTGIPAGKTAGEITDLLVRSGAKQIATDYNSGRVVGLRWVLSVPGGGDQVFAMPARVDPVFKKINGRRQYNRMSNAVKDREQAERVAWRQLLRWVQAQLAMIDCGMAEASEVFFPYLQTSTGSTVYELFRGQGFKMIAAPEEHP